MNIISRQEILDKTMCKPGYRYIRALDDCAGYGGGTADQPIRPTTPELPPMQDMPSPDAAIKQQVAKRAAEKSPKMM